MNRSTHLAQLASASEPFDLLIIGGGATGLGTAVDAAARGHRVALLERDDFAKGTSSRSTKPGERRHSCRRVGMPDGPRMPLHRSRRQECRRSFPLSRSSEPAPP